MSNNNEVENRFFGRDEFYDWLDRMARATMGVSGDEFLKGYRLGRFAEHPVARDLAAVIPLVVTDDGVV
jgi:hypothetical protein